MASWFVEHPDRISGDWRTGDALRHFLELLAKGDVRGIERMLADDVKAVTDGGGEFAAARRPVRGVTRVARFFARLAASRSGGMKVTFRLVNGLPAAVLEFVSSPGRRAPKLLLALNIDRAGLVSSVWVVASSVKLTALDGPPRPDVWRSRCYRGDLGADPAATAYPAMMR